MHSLFSQRANGVPASASTGGAYPYHPDTGMDGFPSPNLASAPTPGATPIRPYSGPMMPAPGFATPEPSMPSPATMTPPVAMTPPVTMTPPVAPAEPAAPSPAATAPATPAPAPIGAAGDGFPLNQFPNSNIPGMPSGDAFDPPAGGDFNADGSLISPPGSGSTVDVARPIPGTMQWYLAQELGYYVECEFLIGTQNIVRRSGILYLVGVSYLVLYDDVNGYYTVCDFYSLKFITYHNRRTSPSAPFDPPSMTQGV